MTLKKISWVLVFLALIAAGFGAYELAYWEKIFPGVSVAEINMGNKSVEEASQSIGNYQNRHSQLELAWGTSRWTLSTDQLGLEINATASAQQAFETGRNGSIKSNWEQRIGAWKNGLASPLVVSLDENRTIEAVSEIASQIDIPAQEPEIKIENGQIIVNPGENGQAVDERVLLTNIKLAVSTISRNLVEIPVRQLRPKLSDAEVSQLRSKAQAYLGKKITLQLDGQTWDITDTQIIGWISPVDVAGWKEMEMQTWIKELAQTVNRPARNAHFKYVTTGKVEEFQPAEHGISLDEDGLFKDLLASIDSLSLENNPRISLPVTKTDPDISTSQVNDLGIKELIARGESNYTGSIPNRIFNLTKAAGQMDGILVAPGEEFSFNKHIGDISLAGGYKQAYIIQNGRTVLGDGGGVCQVSTTMFRAALAAGLPITERHSHAYRVSYYENDRQPGYDATIFTPSVDFKFKNDTPGYILIQTVLDANKKSLAFEFYGTKDGREVTISKARVWDQAAPPPALYQDDPTLPVGTTKQVDFPAWGAKAAFDWKVSRNGEVLQERTFYSSYRPWQAIYLKGTKI